MTFFWLIMKIRPGGVGGQPAIAIEKTAFSARLLLFSARFIFLLFHERIP
jgi:hypothetical protein